MIIGVTGSLGAGKSLFSKLLRAEFERRGRAAEVINADEVVHGLFLGEETGPPTGLFEEMKIRFGEKIFAASGKLDRQALAAAAFSSGANSEALNAIVHPRVIEETKRRMANRPDTVFILDVPLLFESGMDELCDATIAVTANEGIRRERAKKFADFDKRESLQMPESEKARRASRAIANEGTPADLAAAAAEAAENILARRDGV